MKTGSQITTKALLASYTHSVRSSHKPQMRAMDQRRHWLASRSQPVRFSLQTGRLITSIARSFSTVSIHEGGKTVQSGDQTEANSPPIPAGAKAAEGQNAVKDGSNVKVQISKLRETVESGNMSEAYAMLNAMIESNDSEVPSPIDFRCLLDGLKLSKGRKNADMGMTVLQHYKAYVDDNGLHVEENLTPHFNNVLNLWLTCTTPPKRIKLKHVEDIVEVSNLSLAILEDMESRKDCRPTRTAYNFVLNSYVRVSIAAANAGKEAQHYEQTVEIAAMAAEAAEKLVLSMIESRDDARKPDLASYQSLLTAWANVRSLDGSERIVSILETLESHIGLLNTSLYSIVFNALAQAAPMKQFDPTDPDAPANISVALLRRLVSHLKKDRPGPLNAQSYAAVINAFAKSKATRNFGQLAPANLADACLRQCSELHEIGYLQEGPNEYCYGNAIAAWSRHADVDLGCEKAEALLKRLEAHVGVKTTAQNRRQRMVIWYNMVIYALSRSSIHDAPERAEAILDRMTSMAISDERTYEAVLSVWAYNAHSTDDRAKRAEALLAGMTNKPPIMCYNMALAACAATGPEFATNGLRVAEKTFAEIPRPNAASYGRMMSVYNNLLTQDEMERERRLTAVFEQCAKAGNVSTIVLGALNKGISKTAMENIFGKNFAKTSQGYVDIDKLPKPWIRGTLKSRNGNRNSSN